MAEVGDKGVKGVMERRTEERKIGDGKGARRTKTRKDRSKDDDLAGSWEGGGGKEEKTIDDLKEGKKDGRKERSRGGRKREKGGGEA